MTFKNGPPTYSPSLLSPMQQNIGQAEAELRRVGQLCLKLKSNLIWFSLLIRSLYSLYSFLIVYNNCEKSVSFFNIIFGHLWQTAKACFIQNSGTKRVPRRLHTNKNDDTASFTFQQFLSFLFSNGFSANKDVQSSSAFLTFYPTHWTVELIRDTVLGFDLSRFGSKVPKQIWRQTVTSPNNIKTE